MKRSSTSGSLLSLSQWLHTHSSSVPSPCCPLSAGLGSPSLRKSTSGDSPMTKCLKSWTEGKSILSMAMNRRGVLGRRGGGKGARRCIQGCWDADVFSRGLSFSSSPPFYSSHLTLGASQSVDAGSFWCERALSCEALCVCLSLGDCIRRCSSITDGSCCLYSSVGLAEGS